MIAVLWTSQRGHRKRCVTIACETMSKIFDHLCLLALEKFGFLYFNTQNCEGLFLLLVQ